MAVLNKSIKIFLNRVIGPALFIWISYTIYRQIVQQADLHQSLFYIKEAVYGPRAWKWWLVIVLMPVNWLIEARKWQVLLYSLERISIWRSFKAILAGVAFALNTPNRIGEYGGRLLYVQEGKRISSISLTVVGSFSQLIVTMLFGGLGLLFMKDHLAVTATGDETVQLWLKVLQGAVYFICGICILLYFRLGWLVRSAEKMKVAAKWLQYLKIMDGLSVTILLRVLSLSIARYLVFVCQYVLLLDVMHVEVPLWNAFWLISILYLILAFVPTVALLELGVRGKAGIMLFQAFSANMVGIYAAATGIWLVNLVVPALAGSLLAIRLKIFNIKQ